MNRDHYIIFNAVKVNHENVTPEIVEDVINLYCNAAYKIKQDDSLVSDTVRIAKDYIVMFNEDIVCEVEHHLARIYSDTDTDYMPATNAITAAISSLFYNFTSNIVRTIRNVD